MKKFVAVLMSATMLCSLALFASCSDDNGNIGKMDGNFDAEATDEELAEALTQMQSAISGGTILGDTDSQDWSFGFEARMDFDFGMTVTGAGGTETVNIDLGAGYQLALDDEGMKGAGNLSLSGNDTNQTNIDYDIGLYNDVDYMYFDMSSVAENAKFKISWDTLLDAADSVGTPGAVLPDTTEPTMSAAADTGSESDGDQQTDTAVSADIAEIIAGLKEMGCKVYIDDADGLKVKLSVSENTVDMILAALGAELQGISELIEFSAFKCDLYFAMTAEGVFSQISADIDIDMSLDLSGLGVGSYDIDFSGGMYVKAYSGEVEVPDDLASYIERTEVPSLPSPVN